MTDATRIDLRGPDTAARPDQRIAPGDIRLLRAELDSVAGEQACLWQSALAWGGFDEVTRLADATNAVHRAVIALTAPREVPDRRVSAH